MHPWPPSRAFNDDAWGAWRLRPRTREGWLGWLAPGCALGAPTFLPQKGASPGQLGVRTVGSACTLRVARAAFEPRDRAAQAEAAVLAADRARGAGGAGRGAAWNHGEFRVAYASLAPHLCLGGVYVRLLLEGLDQVTRAQCRRRAEG